MLQRLLRKVYRTLKGTHVEITTTLKISRRWYGSNYGGFFVHPDIIRENSIVYSFGVGEDVSFDKAINNHHRCSVFAFDPTPKSIAWVKEQALPAWFSFHPVGVGAVSGELDFFLPQNTEYVSGSMIRNEVVDVSRTIKVPIKSFKDITSELGHAHIDVLKMDIEGAEYDVLPGILSSGVAVDQILIEFHHRMMADGKRLTMDALRLLKAHGYEVFGVSDTFEEVSFIKKGIRGV